MIQKLKFILSKKENANIEKFRKLSIKKRLEGFSIFTVTIPLVIIGIICTGIYYRDMKNQIVEIAQQSIYFLNDSISMELERYLEYSYPFIVSDKVNQILEPSDENMENQDKLKEAINENELTELFWTESYENVILLDNELNIVGSMENVEPDTDWLQQTAEYMQEKKINHYWGSMRTSLGKNIVIFMKRIYSNKEMGKQIGYLNFVLDENRMFRKFYNSLDLENSNTFIIDENYHYVSSHKEKNKIDSSIIKEVPEVRNMNGEKGNFDITYNGKTALFVYDKIPHTNWHLAMAVEKQHMFQGIFQMIVFISIVICVMLGVSLIIVWYMSRSIVKPMAKLMDFTNEVEKGNYNIRIADDHLDEIGRLTRHSNKMVHRLLWYMKTREEELDKRRKLEIQNLLYQIQPHFLFNTLNTFKFIAIMNGNETLGNGITALCDLLKQTVTKTSEKIPLYQEIENIKNYVIIQEFRYAGNFLVKYEIEEGVKEYQMPSLLLQPIVENSIIHGMQEDFLLEIKIQAYVKERELIIIVSDNGKGFEQDNKGEVKSNHFSGIGIENIKERIDIIYHNKGKFEILSKPNNGTTVTIKIPCEEMG